MAETILGHDTKGYFRYSLHESHFDACAAISWDIVAGTLSSSPNQPGATAGSNAETVVFFSYGALVEQPAPPLTATVDAVTLTGETTVAASFNVDKGPRAANEFILLTNHYELSGSTLSETSEELSQAPDPAPRLDISSLATTD